MLKIENKKIIEIVQNHISSSKSEKRNMKLLHKHNPEFITHVYVFFILRWITKLQYLRWLDIYKCT